MRQRKARNRDPLFAIRNALVILRACFAPLFLDLTLAPPPFPAMNSTPADSRNAWSINSGR
jgi:hypothetical protein